MTLSILSLPLINKTSILSAQLISNLNKKLHFYSFDKEEHNGNSKEWASLTKNQSIVCSPLYWRCHLKKENQYLRGGQIPGIPS